MNSNAVYYKAAAITFSALFLVIFLMTPTSFSQSPAKLKSKEEEVRESMVVISRQLGVTCNACHDTQNFQDDKKIEFKIAKEHMRVVNLLNQEGFRGTPKVDCYMCHKGQLKPDYREPKNPVIQK